MDFDKTSFSVDWFTPGRDKYVPKRLSFPKSARISLDDLVPDSPLNFCLSPVDAVIPKPCPPSFVDTHFESAHGWSSSAPPSPLAPPDNMYDQYSKGGEEDEGAMDFRNATAASPGLMSVADDCALCGVDLDVSCLDALDEELLLSPVQCFSELCWADAVRDEVTAPVLHKRRRSRTRSFKCDNERAFPPPLEERDYPGSFECTRPLAARIALPLDAYPHYVSTPPSPSCERHDTSPIYKEKPIAYFADTDPEGRFLALPVQGMPIPRCSKKREQILTRSLEPLAPPKPPTACVHPSKSSPTLRVLSDAYSSLTRPRRKSPK